MSAPDFGFLANDNLPSRDTIVTLCKAAGYDCSGLPPATSLPGPSSPGTMLRGFSLPIQQPACGSHGFTRLSRDTSKSNWAIGYIVMQYIDAPDCGEGDHQLVATAVPTLIGLKGPSSAPGPVSGGRVIRNFSSTGRHQ
ncbi:hypothetical protein V8E52_006969 [Russula decolorans]